MTPKDQELQNWSGGTLNIIKLIRLNSRFASICIKVQEQKWSSFFCQIVPFFSHFLFLCLYADTCEPALLMFTAWLQLDYGKILCNFCLLEFTRGPNGKCFNEEFALAFIGKCYKWLLLFSSTNSVDSQKYLDGSTKRFEDEKS